MNQSYVAHSLNERGTVTRHARYAQLKTRRIDSTAGTKRARLGLREYIGNDEMFRNRSPAQLQIYFLRYLNEFQMKGKFSNDTFT